MRIPKAALVAAGVAFIAACSSITVTNDHDPEANFTAYKTYSWLEPTQGKVGGFWDGRIHKAVDAQLQAKGFTQSAENPDVRVTYMAALDKQVRVDTTGYGGGYGYGYGRYGWGGGGMSTSTVTEVPVGTLVIDIVDSAKKQLAWRGKATGTLSNTDNPEAAQVKLDQTIAEMFAAYPPKK